MCFEFFEAFGLACLTLETGHLAFDLKDNIVDPQEVLIGGGDLAQGFFFAIFIPCHTSGFLYEESPLFRAGIGDGADIPLLDDRVGLGAHAASHEHIVDIFQPARLAVDRVGALTGAVQSPGHIYFRKIFEFFRCRTIVVQEGERYLCHIQRCFPMGA